MNDEAAQHEMQEIKSRHESRANAIKARRAVRIARTIDHFMTCILKVIVAGVAGGVFGWDGLSVLIIAFVTYGLLSLVLALVHDISLVATGQSIRCSGRIRHRMPQLPNN